MVIPVINSHYCGILESARQEVNGSDQVIPGDGRFDSPGKSAKYCTYSCQATTTNKIVAMSTIQTVLGKGSAPLEMAAFKNCLLHLETNSYRVSTIATDRNKQIAKWIRIERPTIDHKYDPWHFVKNVKAKLRPLTKRKDRKILQDWINPIGNHLFWCSEKCNGDSEQLIQMWKSLLHHVTN